MLFFIAPDVVYSSYCTTCAADAKCSCSAAWPVKLVLSHLVDNEPSTTDAGDSRPYSHTPYGLRASATGISWPPPSYSLISDSEMLVLELSRTLVKMN